MYMFQCVLFSGKTEGRRTFHGGYLQVKQLVREQNTSFYRGLVCVGCCFLIQRGGGGDCSGYWVVKSGRLQWVLCS